MFINEWASKVSELKDTFGELIKAKGIDISKP